jgi:Flp pilus assembly pilin Flp
MENKMKTNRCEFSLTSVFKSVVIIAALSLLPATAHAQWTTSGNNIYNTNTTTTNVGVGNDLPNYRLDVATQNTTDSAQIRFGLGGGNSGGFLYSGSAAHATFAAGASFNSGSWTARSLNASIIEANQGQLSFYANGNLSNGSTFTPIARMVMTSSGMVGIGTTTPDTFAKLHVYGSGGFGQDIQTTTADWTRLRLITPSRTWGFFLDGQTAGLLAQGSLGLYDYTASAFRMVFHTNGNVGIGNNAPGYKLDVGGQINSSTGLCMNGDCRASWSAVGGSQWTGSSALNYSGNVGVGLTGAPTRRLEVLGGNVFHQWSATAGAEYGFYTAINNNHLASNMYFDGQWKMIATGKGAVVSTAPNNGGNAMAVYADNTSRAINAVASPVPVFVVTMDSKVGVSTSAPSYSLDVNGGVNSFRAKASTSASGDTIATFENSSAIQMIVRANGNVGIGTTSPTEKLHVGGNVKITGDIDVTGNIKAKYQDVAEWVESSQELAAGTVVILDSSKSNQVIASTQSYDSRVAGVISLKPGLQLGEEGEGRVLVATTGRVKVKVDAGSGPIQIGDLLVTSDKSGMAMKSLPVEIGGVRIHRPGTLIGKALEPLAQGTGEILVLLSLQ